MTGNIGIIAIILGVIFTIYQAIRNAILNKDITKVEQKTTLLDTVIEAKNTTIAEDEEKVKEASDAYENSKRINNPGSGQH